MERVAKSVKNAIAYTPQSTVFALFQMQIDFVRFGM